MGVHGLTTYLREKKRLLSTTTVVSPSSKISVPIVVDGWSFIYNLYQTSGLPWVYGGEYVEFGRLVKVAVEAWIQVGLQVYFVFDGACPDLKFPTVISRLSQSCILPAQLFFRTSSVSRSTGRFLNENRILPPLAYSTCLHALETLRDKGLEIHYADEEGDPYAVELAGRIGGYVVGNDSDFVILNSDGYRGYIPLEEMVWQAPLPEVPTPINEDDDDFQTVRKPKAKRKVPQHLQNVVGLLPPENTDDLSLSFVSYSPDTLAKHLNIPITLLPLFGALVGNDFSKEPESNSRKIQAMFFERHLTLSQRIDKVANTIHSVVSPGSMQRKAKHQVGSVMDLIDRTVNALLTRLIGTMGSGEIEDIIEKIVNATLQYAIPKYGGQLTGREGLWPTSVCALHEPEACSLLPMISHNVMCQSEISDQADPSLLDAREKYLDAYRNGLLSPKIMDLLCTGSSWARLFLENPDLETVGRSIGRPIREWVQAVIQDTVGIPIAVENTPSTREDISIEDESDDDELIDVVESESDEEDDLPRPDFLAPLKGALHRLHSEEPSGSEDSATDPPASIISHRHLPTCPPVVTEYLRRGTRIASETITIKSLSELLPSITLSEYADDSAPPLVLRSDEERFTVLLRILKSDIQSVRDLPPKIITSVLAVRWVVHTLHLRSQETGSKEREKERWTKNEARCLLSSFAWASKDVVSQGTHLNSDPPPIEDRNVQLMAQVLMALEAIEQLSQSLLLLERVPGTAHHLSGRAFHALLTATASIETHLPVGVWEAVEIDLLDAFQEVRVKKGKRTNAAKAPAASSLANGSQTKMKNKGLFAMLGDIEA